MVIKGLFFQFLEGTFLLGASNKTSLSSFQNAYVRFIAEFKIEDSIPLFPIRFLFSVFFNLLAKTLVYYSCCSRASFVALRYLFSNFGLNTQMNDVLPSRKDLISFLSKRTLDKFTSIQDTPRDEVLEVGLWGIFIALVYR